MSFVMQDSNNNPEQGTTGLGAGTVSVAPPKAASPSDSNSSLLWLIVPVVMAFLWWFLFMRKGSATVHSASLNENVSLNQGSTAIGSGPRLESKTRGTEKRTVTLSETASESSQELRRVKAKKDKKVKQTPIQPAIATETAFKTETSESATKFNNPSVGSTTSPSVDPVTMEMQTEGFNAVGRSIADHTPIFSKMAPIPKPIQTDPSVKTEPVEISLAEVSQSTVAINAARMKKQVDARKKEANTVKKNNALVGFTKYERHRDPIRIQDESVAPTNVSMPPRRDEEPSRRGTAQVATPEVSNEPVVTPEARTLRDFLKRPASENE